MELMKTKTINSLYIHIPFCHHICPYCDFLKFLPIKKYCDKYIEVLLEELKNLNISHRLKTIYIGGGTPSAILLTPLLKKLQDYIAKDTEFTIECNVLDINDTLLKEYQNYHVNRISLGVQALDDRILKVLGREHNKNDAIKAIKCIKKYIKNINVDLIYGFLELDNKTLLNELEEYIKLNVTHISTYALEINPGTIFFIKKKEAMDSSLIREQFDLINAKLKKNGFMRYEIANFAKKGYKAKHNLTYWKDERYYGIGPSAAGFIDNIRYKNTTNIEKYLLNQYRDNEEIITLDDDKKYYLMLNLRLKEGVSLSAYKKRFNEDLYLTKKDAIDKLCKHKLLKISYTRLVATYEGSMLLDIILRELF